MRLELRDVALSTGDFSLEVDLTITARVTALFGRSGAGKTTLLEVLAGLRSLSRGDIVFDGEPLTKNGVHIIPSRHRRMGYVPQESLLFPHLSVRGNIEFGLRRETGDATELRHVVETLEIASLLERDVTTLSGGEKRRVALARALVTSPALLLLDEPLAGLERPLQEKLLTYLRRVRDEFAVPMIYVTHVAEEVVELAEGAVVLERGRVAREGAPDTIFTTRSRVVYELAD